MENYCHHFEDVFPINKWGFSNVMLVFRGVNTSAWNLNHLFINGCFNWMIPNHYIRNGCFTKHPFKNGCLGYQVEKNILRSRRYVPRNGTGTSNRKDLVEYVVGMSPPLVGLAVAVFFFPWFARSNVQATNMFCSENFKVEVFFSNDCDVLKIFTNTCFLFIIDIYVNIHMEYFLVLIYMYMFIYV